MEYRELFKGLYVLLILVVSISFSACAQIDKGRSFSEVFWNNPPEPVGYVNDYEDLFIDEEEQRLETFIDSFAKRTTIQIAVVTFDTTMTSADSLDALTSHIANIWKVGQEDKNNGIVIGISRAYRRMRISNGDGIKRVLSDEDTKGLIDAVFIPHYRKDEYYQGTYSGLQTLVLMLKERYK